jgi:hypothetical protein
MALETYLSSVVRKEQKFQIFKNFELRKLTLLLHRSTYGVISFYLILAVNLYACLLFLRHLPNSHVVNAKVPCHNTPSPRAANSTITTPLPSFAAVVYHLYLSN